MRNGWPPLLIVMLAAGFGCQYQQDDVATIPPPSDSAAFYEPDDSYVEPTPIMVEPPARPARTAYTPPPVVRAAAPPAPEPVRTYVVQRGDTMWDIAQRVYGEGQRWPDIAAANQITDPKKLRVGQKLTLP